MPNLGAPEILVILLVALIFLGPQRLPEVGRQIGGAIRELRKVQSDVRGHIDDALRPDDEPTPVETLESRSVDDAGLEGGVDAGGVHDDNLPPPPTTSFS